ncbi:MAG TPA: ComEA family DNA-binding protein [Nocardioidaceae bacterium]|nr:ComEA family DNA-binding protein [Nocardioidaceae bacterium]
MLARSLRGRSRAAVDREAARRRLAKLGLELAPGPSDRPADPPLDPDPDPLAVGAGRHAAQPIGRARRWWGVVADRLSPGMRSAMDGTFSGQHLGVLAVVLATGLAITAWWVLSARPEPQSVPQASFETAASPDTPRPAADSPRASATGRGMVIVDVAGKVRRPGIVTLPAGSRVIDALEAAGGARPDVDLIALNLARVLVDGEQIVVGVDPVALPPTAGTAATPSTTGGLVDLNTADQVTLETLPGVGPVTAQAILDWRTQNGAFTSVDELLEVDGIGDVTLAELRDLVTV